MVFADESDRLEFWIKMLVTPVGLFLFFDRFFPFLFDKLDGLKPSKGSRKVNRLVLFFVAFEFILISWIPAWAVEYPGIITPDTLNQLNQVHAIYPFSNANPFIHTIILNGLHTLISLFVKDSLSVYFWIGFVQMIFMAAVCAYATVFVYDKSKSYIATAGTVLFFAFASFNVFYSVTISKDAVYAAFALLFVIFIDRYFKTQNKVNALLFIFSGVMYCLMRENGFFSLAFTILVFLILTRTNYKKVFVSLLVTFLIASVIKYPIYSFAIGSLNSSRNVNYLTAQNYLDISDELVKNDIYKINGRRGEDTATDKDYFRGSFLYVMAFQQVANVVAHDRQLTEKEEWMIEELIPISVIKKVYNPMLVDPIFQYASYYGTPKAIEIGVFEYLKLWVSLMFRYPQDYVEAYVNMTKYYFYPNRYVNMYYIGIADNELGIKQKSIVSDEFKKNLEDAYYRQKNLPLIASVYSPGTVSFILLIAVFYHLNRRHYDSLLGLLPLLGNFLILMACVPINDEFRYCYPMVLCLPYILVCLVSKRRNSIFVNACR